MDPPYPTAHQIHQLEDRINAQRHPIEVLLRDNKRLAAAHVVLKQDIVAAQDDRRRLATAVASVKADRDAKIRLIYDRYLKLEAEAQYAEGLPDEIDRIRAEIKELRAEHEGLSKKMKDIDGEIDTTRSKLRQKKMKDIDGEIDTTRSKLRQVEDLNSEIESMQRDIKRGNAAIEYERKMHSKNYEMSDAMKKHLVAMAREEENLRSEIQNAEKRAMAKGAMAKGA